MSKYLDAAVKSLRKPICEGRGIQVFRLEENEIPPLPKGVAAAVEKIISDYEKGKMSYEDAQEAIVPASKGHPALYWMEVDLFAAKQNMKTDHYLKPVVAALRKVKEDGNPKAQRAIALIIKGEGYKGRQLFKDVSGQDRMSVLKHEALSSEEQKLLDLYFRQDNNYDEVEAQMFKLLGIDTSGFE